MLNTPIRPRPVGLLIDAQITVAPNPYSPAPRPSPLAPIPRPMPALFDKLGIKFLYPDDWTLEPSTDEDQQGATVYSPGGAFWSVVVRGRDDDPVELAKVAMAAIGDLYTDIDTEAVEETIGGHELVGYNLNFYCLDLTNTAQIRACRHGDRTLLIIWQAEDREFDEVSKVFRAITTSLLYER
jgi:hypothetical protein